MFARARDLHALSMATGRHDYCNVCHTDDQQNNLVKWMGCNTCNAWVHRKCVNMHEVKNIERTPFICHVCVQEYITLKRKAAGKLDEVLVKLGEMVNEVQGLKATVKDQGERGAAEAVAGPVTADAQLTSAGAAWATVASRNKKKKNLLILKATEDGEKAKEKKKEVSQALTGVQIKDSRFTTSGNIIMNFENETVLEEAAEKLKTITQISTKNVRKLMPKVMICNVNSEESEEDLIKDLIDRNDYLQEINDVDNKIKIITKKQAAGGTVHYILKFLDPRIRCLIHENNDKVLLTWGVHKVIDRYHPLSCFHCQRFGHMSEKCHYIAEPASCFRCAGPHRSGACPRNHKKCINCVRYNYTETNHSAMDYCCPIFKNEQAKISDLTDHGY